MYYDVKDISKLLEVSEKQTRNIINKHEEELIQNQKRILKREKGGRGKAKILLNENAVKFILCKHNNIPLNSLDRLDIQSYIYDKNSYPFESLDNEIKAFETLENILLSTNLKSEISKLKFDYARLISENESLKEINSIINQTSDYFEQMSNLANQLAASKNEYSIIQESYIEKLDNFTKKEKEYLNIINQLKSELKK